MHKKAALSLALALSGAFFLSSDASAGLPDTACCLQSTSLVDGWMNPVTGGDEDFFTQPGGPPNLLWLIDNSCSMQGWPFQLCTGSTGCDCAQLNALGYSPTASYEPEWQNINSGSRYDEWFHKDKAYEVRPLPSNSFNTDPVKGYGDDPPGGSNKPDGTIWGSKPTRLGNMTDACTSGMVLDATCLSCLQTKGYYLNKVDETKSRMVGNFLNLFSPRFLMLRRTLKEVLKEVRVIRMASVAFKPGGSVDQPPGVVTDWNPACNQSDPFSNGSSFDSNRQSIVSMLDTLQFRSDTPLTKSLYAAGHFFTNASGTNIYNSTFGNNWHTAMGLTSGNATRTQESQFTERTGGNQLAVCAGCTFNAIALLTDGEPSDSGGWEDKVPAPVGDTAHEIAWDDCPGDGGTGECLSSDLDEVAKFLWSTDLRSDYTGKQRVATYTLAFGLDPNSWAQRLLRHTAAVGGGQNYSAYTSAQLKKALLEIIEDVNNRNTSFSAATVASLQTSNTGLSAVLPRMRPQRDTPWQGGLYRFKMGNEFALDQDIDGDGVKDDVFILDKNDKMVSEDSDGTFLAAEPDGGVPPAGSTAVPFWEGSQRLKSLGHANRNVYTVIEASGDNSLTEADDNRPSTDDSGGVLSFNTANLDRLMPYLGIRGTARCPTGFAAGEEGEILTNLGLSLGTAAAALGEAVPITADGLHRLCAKVLVQFIRGQDLGDEDKDLNRTETRDSVLGDIFHSSPVEVVAPVDSFLCDLGIHNQCARTIYSQDLGGVAPTQLDSPASQTDCSSNPTTRNAYEAYAWKQRKRDKLILVGANDGMLHAFRDTEASETCSAGVSKIEHSHTAGAGKEEWAFIPPDQLARLWLLTKRHQYFVDGDLMVRDIWADDDNDGVKQADEFHTLAVVAEGRGGTHYFALEIKYDANGQHAVRPGFRWVFPQPCSKEASLFGKTLYALSPKPPPIGPVLIDKSSFTSPPTTYSRHGVDTVERWVVALSGGWSPAMEKGRGIYVVDAWKGKGLNGSRGDNLLWKMELDPTAAGEQHGPQKHLTHSVAAPVALVDYGPNSGFSLDGFFDTAVFGDTFGQLWVARMFQPGKLSGSDPYLITNWSGARGFEMDRDNRYPDSSDNDSLSPQPDPGLANRWPFFYLPSAGIQPETGALRAFIGTGNRYALLEKNAGKCRFDNPAACSKYQCPEVKVASSVAKGDFSIDNAETHWRYEGSAARFEHGQLASSAGAKTWCGDPGDLDVVVTKYNGRYYSSSCPNVAVSWDAGLGSTEIRCGQPDAGVLGSNFACWCQAGCDPNTQELKINPSSTLLSGLGKNRFYGVWLYGAHDDRKFTEDTSGDGGANTFDSRRLTDRGSTDLVDVTNVGCTESGCDGGAPENGWGWFLEYPELDHKTASGAAVLASCVMWNEMYPGSVDAGTLCTPQGVPRTRFMQGDFITGTPNCAAAFKSDAGVYARYQERTVIAPPPEPAMAIQVSKTGQVKYSVMVVEPGQSAVGEVNVGSNQEPLQLVYELPVSRPLHQCRHLGEVDAGCFPISP